MAKYKVKESFYFTHPPITPAIGARWKIESIFAVVYLEFIELATSHDLSISQNILLKI